MNKIMGRLCALVVIAISTTLAKDALGDTLCRGHERNLFSCKMKENSKTVSVCMSTERDSASGNDFQQLQYRFGEPEKIEFEFRGKKKKLSSSFYRPKNGLLLFLNGNYLYTVGRGLGNYPQSFSGVIVENRAKRIHTELECDASTVVELQEEGLPNEIASEDDVAWLRYYHFYDKSDSRAQQSDQLCTKPVVDAVAKHFGINDLIGAVVSEACNPWADKQDQILATFAYDDGNAKNDEKLLVIALVDMKAKKIIAAYKGSIGEDAAMRVQGNSLSIDYTSYGLVAPGIALFGVDVMSGYIANCGDGGGGSDRTYFVVDGKAIRPVLSQFMTSSWYYTKGGNSRCGSSSEDVETENTYYSITVVPKSTGGFADLLFTAQPSSTKMESFHCELHYDGKQYLLPYMDKDCQAKYNEWGLLYSKQVPRGQ